MNFKLKYMVWIVLIMIVGSCKKPYNPPAISSPNKYLVVEGTINIGTALTTIKLSRTVNVSSNALAPELNATVTIETDNNETFPMIETDPGTFIYFLNPDAAKKYRLKIVTADGLQYLSDFEAVQNTPLIDSLGYSLQKDGMQIYVNAHDPTNTVKYYRWDYTEAWRFHSKYESDYIVQNNQLYLRSNQVYDCFAGDTSSNIVLGSTADLKQGVVYQQPITNIKASSEKLESEYSILVTQYALTADAYRFWTNLKKNTEELGGIFDAQPSELSGNIHCTTMPSLPVIGYVSVTNSQSKRIFIKNQDLPAYFFPAYPYDCRQDTVKLEDLGPVLNALPDEYDITTAILKNGQIIGYFVTTPICADCTLRGTTAPPYFWQ